MSYMSMTIYNIYSFLFIIVYIVCISPVGGLGTEKSSSGPWRGRPAAGLNLETGQLPRHHIAEILLYITMKN